MSNSENTITTAFFNAFRPMRQAWSVSEQIAKPFLNASKNPDVIVTEFKRNPIVIEVKIDEDTPNLSGKIQAEAHFGRRGDSQQSLHKSSGRMSFISAHVPKSNFML